MALKAGHLLVNEFRYFRRSDCVMGYEKVVASERTTRLTWHVTYAHAQQVNNSIHGMAQNRGNWMCD